MRDHFSVSSGPVTQIIIIDQRKAHKKKRFKRIHTKESLRLWTQEKRGATSGTGWIRILIKHSSTLQDHKRLLYSNTLNKQTVPFSGHDQGCRLTRMFPVYRTKQRIHPEHVLCEQFFGVLCWIQNKHKQNGILVFWNDDSFFCVFVYLFPRILFGFWMKKISFQTCMASGTIRLPIPLKRMPIVCYQNVSTTFCFTRNRFIF